MAPYIPKVAALVAVGHLVAIPSRHSAVAVNMRPKIHEENKKDSEESDKVASQGESQQGGVENVRSEVNAQNAVVEGVNDPIVDVDSECSSNPIVDADSAKSGIASVNNEESQSGGESGELEQESEDQSESQEEDQSESQEEEQSQEDAQSSEEEQSPVEEESPEDEQTPEDEDHLERNHAGSESPEDEQESESFRYEEVSQSSRAQDHQDNDHQDNQLVLVSQGLGRQKRSGNFLADLPKEVIRWYLLMYFNTKELHDLSRINEHMSNVVFPASLHRGSLHRGPGAVTGAVTPVNTPVNTHCQAHLFRYIRKTKFGYDWGQVEKDLKLWCRSRGWSSMFEAPTRTRRCCGPKEDRKRKEWLKTFAERVQEVNQRKLEQAEMNVRERSTLESNVHRTPKPMFTVDDLPAIMGYPGDVWRKVQREETREGMNQGPADNAADDAADNASDCTLADEERNMLVYPATGNVGREYFQREGYRVANNSAFCNNLLAVPTAVTTEREGENQNIRVALTSERPHRELVKIEKNSNKIWVRRKEKNNGNGNGSSASGESGDREKSREWLEKRVGNGSISPGALISVASADDGMRIAVVGARPNTSDAPKTDLWTSADGGDSWVQRSFAREGPDLSVTRNEEVPWENRYDEWKLKGVSWQLQGVR
jgi:hypothetical protein